MQDQDREDTLQPKSRAVWLTNVDQKHGLPVDPRKERMKMELPYFARGRSKTKRGVYP